MKLDIGCGHLPTGDVNVELFLEATNHRSDNQKECKDTPIETESVSNLVVANAEYLPFKDDSFENVYSSHTIEHINSPLRMIFEMKRVCENNGKLTLIMPFWLSDGRNKVLHKWKFNKKNLSRLLNKANFNSKITIEYSRFRYIPHSLVRLIYFPSELKATVTVRKMK